jgi:hypothetical protein
MVSSNIVLDIRRKEYSSEPIRGSAECMKMGKTHIQHKQHASFYPASETSGQLMSSISKCILCGERLLLDV